MHSLRTNVNHATPYTRAGIATTTGFIAGSGGNGDGSGKEPPPLKLGGAAGDESGRPNGDGDIIYGGRAIADFMFPEEPKRDCARRRVYNLAAHYFARKEKAGFFKLKGALCLSKKQWRSFHGLS